MSVRLTANLLRQRSLHKRWHRHQARCHILRSQLGFATAESDRPQVCIGCIYYHGKRYGQTRETRQRLICGFHPSGWEGDGDCPDAVISES
ncbi:MAG: hypothetical protein AB4058_11580 [Microcystaceae cyanobacterium]